jgi:hypothetical protein
MATLAQHFATVAIPACNEAACVEDCLAALAVQRDPCGSPIAADAFEILIFANNCTDATARRARALARHMPQRVVVVEELLPRAMANAGWARKRAMDLAAERLAARGVILTTDADSCVAPTWFAANMAELDRGVHCVAGYIDAKAHDIVSLGAALLARGRREDTYLRLVAEIAARCDPRAHDPWPNHGVSSGASLAVTVAAYRAIGGLPARPLGEDAALTAALEEAGFKVRHSLDVAVQTSCRVIGRAAGGAADTIRRRLNDPEAPCDDDLEPALPLARRAIWKCMLRRSWQTGQGDATLTRRLGLPKTLLAGLRAEEATFAEAWDAVCHASVKLAGRRTLQPSELPRQIAIAKLILAALRRQSVTTSVPAGTPHREGSGEAEFA